MQCVCVCACVCLCVLACECSSEKNEARRMINKIPAAATESMFTDVQLLKQQEAASGATSIWGLIMMDALLREPACAWRFEVR